MKLKMLQRFIQDETGVESAEFAMVLALICLSLVAAIVTLVTAVKALFISGADIYSP